MSLLNDIQYFYSKAILYLQRPSIRNSDIHETSKIGFRSNVINTKLDRYSYCGNNNSISNAKIGSFCSIASYCAIGGAKHPLDRVSTSPIFYDKNNIFKIVFSNYEKTIEPLTTKIGNDVWIGESVFIKEGVKIGDGAVVGAHSVVTRDIPPYGIAVGAPARTIKFRFEDEVIEKLLEFSWWNWDDEKIIKYQDYFDSPLKLIEKVKGE